jgi:HK97 family phage portal protein
MRIFGLPVPFTGERQKALNAVSESRGWFRIMESFTGAWQRNVEIDNRAVQAHHADFACKTLIASDIAKLRIKLVEQDNDGIWSETKNPAYSPVLRKPNHYQNRIQFWESWALSKLSRGNTYALKARDARNVVVALYVLDPNKVTPLVSDDGDVFYRLATDNMSRLEDDIVVPAREIIHDRMNCLFHPLVGVSPLFAAGCVANLGLKIEKNSSNFFGNGSQPSGILTAPGAISDDTAKTLADYFNENFTGEKSGRVAVLGDGLKYEQLSMTAEDSQLIEQLRWTAEVICSTFHVPPYKIGVGPMPTYNNIEALQQDYYNTCLQSLIEEYEACMDEGLGLSEDLGVELDLDGLLRMDSKTQVDVLNASVSGSLRTINEARKKLNLSGVDGGEVIWSQQQNWPISELAKRPAEALAGKPAAAPPAPVAAPEPEEVDETDKALGLLFRKAPGELHAS